MKSAGNIKTNRMSPLPLNYDLMKVNDLVSKYTVISAIRRMDIDYAVGEYETVWASWG